MSATTQISEDAYQRIVVSDPDRQWELHDGRLREKPGKTWDHLEVAAQHAYVLANQIDRLQFRVFVGGRVRLPTATIFLADLMVVPAGWGKDFRGRPGTLAIFPAPLPLVVEVWLIHPHDKTLTDWRRQPDGTDNETVYRDGAVTPAMLPGVTIHLSELFEA